MALLPFDLTRMRGSVGPRTGMLHFDLTRTRMRHFDLALSPFDLTRTRMRHFDLTRTRMSPDGPVAFRSDAHARVSGPEDSHASFDLTYTRMRHFDLALSPFDLTRVRGRWPDGPVAFRSDAHTHA